MARLAGVPAGSAGLLVRLVYAVARRMVGRLPEPLTISAHQPAIFRASTAFEFFLGRARRVGPRLKALGEIKAAALVGCPF